MCNIFILTYGPQTWSFTLRQRSRLEIFQLVMEHIILGFGLLIA